MSKALITFQLYPEGAGEPIQLDIDSRDVVMWENLSKSHRIKDLQENQRFSDLYKLAHLAARRQQLFTGSLEDFQAQYALDIDEDQETGADPTQPEA